MKMIFKSIVLSKKNIRFFQIFTILLTLVITIVIIKNGIDNKIYYEENKEEYLTVYIKIQDQSSIDLIKKLDFIKNISKEGENYKLILNSSQDVKTFVLDYEYLYTDIMYNQYPTSSLINVLNTILNVIIYVFSIIIIILLTLNIVEIIISQSKNISFYKMLGFKNKIVHGYLLFMIVVSYTMLYAISISISLILKLVIENVFHQYGINLTFLQPQIIIYIYLVIILLIASIVGMLYLKIRKISPIKFASIN